VVLWASFLFVMLLLSFASPLNRKKTRSTIWQPPTSNVGKVEKWHRLLSGTQTTRFSKWRLAQELKHLTRNLHTSIEGEGWKRVKLTDLDIPPEISYYFEARQPSNDPILKRLFSAGEQTETALDLDPEIVIQYLEERLKY
jgi:hypothetical protein